MRIDLSYYWISSTSVTNDFHILGCLRLFWLQKFMVQKNCFLLIERNKPFQHFDFFLSDYVLASKWPPFAIPIHSGCPVYDECSQVKNAIHANLDHSWKISKNFAETCALQILEKSDRVWQNFVKFKRISYNFVLQNLETILFVIYHG